MSQSLGVFLKKKELQTAFILDDFINCIYCLQTTSDVLLWVLSVKLILFFITSTTVFPFCNFYVFIIQILTEDNYLLDVSTNVFY